VTAKALPARRAAYLRSTMKTIYALLAAGVVLLSIGTWNGLAVAPPERYMGEVQRIMYVHVPTAWSAMLVLTWACLCAIVYLLTERLRCDHRLEASVEMSVVLCFLLSVQGAIWAKPTWGVWWDWDPRLTTVAILLFAFLAIVALRQFVPDPRRRASWSAVATVIAYADVPIVYFSVKWWNSLHQQQSTPSTISRDFLVPLFANFAGLLLVITATLIARARVAAKRMEEELPPSLELVA
jgi:heme exporter protein C